MYVYCQHCNTLPTVEAIEVWIIEVWILDVIGVLTKSGEELKYVLCSTFVDQSQTYAHKYKVSMCCP